MLHEVTFSVPKGRTVAVVGESGSGKSTLVRLLLRFYSPDSGAILLDGVDIATMSLQDLRRDVAIVPQDTLLFNETIEFNIAVGNPTATRVQVAHAMSIAGLEPLIRSLPLGGETVVGERGLKLSGGEKQRIAIARAVLRQPRAGPMVPGRETGKICKSPQRQRHQCGVNTK